jgi:hypothetical protein
MALVWWFGVGGRKHRLANNSCDVDHSKGRARTRLAEAKKGGDSEGITAFNYLLFNHLRASAEK